jgi:hypothetical protein
MKIIEMWHAGEACARLRYSCLIILSAPVIFDVKKLITYISTDNYKNKKAFPTFLFV